MSFIADDALLTGTQAALHFKTSVAVVCMWRNRGHLKVAEMDARGKPLYRFGDLKVVERAMRQTRERGIRPGKRRDPRPPWPTRATSAA